MGCVLVTGGLGFDGSHVVDALVDRGEGVRVLDRLHPLSHRAEPGYQNPEGGPGGKGIANSLFQ